MRLTSASEAGGDDCYDRQSLTDPTIFLFLSGIQSTIRRYEFRRRNPESRTVIPKVAQNLSQHLAVLSRTANNGRNLRFPALTLQNHGTQLNRLGPGPPYDRGHRVGGRIGGMAGRWPEIR
jgi:hypothetical protein